MMMLAMAMQIASPPPPTDEIVVLGSRLAQVGVNMNIDRKGRLRSCSVTRSVGDAALERFWCDAGVACAAQKPKDAAALQACVDAHKDEFLEKLAASRQLNETH